MNFLREISGPALNEELPNSWIFDRVEEWARRYPDRIAFTLDRSEAIDEYRYPDVLHHASSIAGGLMLRGIGPGDRVGILMENIPQWVFALLGVMKLGAVAVPLATTLAEPVILNLTRHAGCKLIFADAPNLTKACNVGESLAISVVGYGGSDPRATSWTSFAVRGGERAFPSQVEDTVALIIYTSGTTGDPKGVQLTVRNLIYEIRGISEALDISSDNRILSVLPFSHVLPLMANSLGPLCVGASVVFLSSISPQRIVEAFHRHRITCFICVPQFFYALHKKIFSEVAAQPLPARKLFQWLLSGARCMNNRELKRRMFARIHRKLGPDLRILASGGSRFDAQIAADFNALGYTMLNAYGLTETCAAVTATRGNERAEGTVGRPIRGVSIRIEKPNSEGIGEIGIRGPILMKGYYLDVQHTAEVLRDGWFWSGDLGFIRPDGNLTLTGRSKEVIVLANGKNIYPEEIEAHYAQSEFIQEICVLGLSDGGPEGEKLHAIVVPNLEEFRRRGLSTILDWIRFDIENLSRQLPSYQRVLSLSIRNEPLPRTVTRKLKRFEIQQEEMERRRLHGDESTAQEDDVRFTGGVGAQVAALVRKAKPAAGALQPAMNLELDLGFDSLARVELLGELEARLGLQLDEAQASRIYTLGELIAAFENPAATGAGARRWNEILAGAAAWRQHYIFASKPLSKIAAIGVARIVRLCGKLFFNLKWSGLEKLPQPPFLICPNHESYLDGLMLYAALPASVIRMSFGLGLSEYWKGKTSGWIARHTNIVPLDSGANLVRGMQIAAAGLQGGKVLVIFPEGTRSINGHVAEFKKGAAILACETSVPVVPVGINGTYESWPRVGPFRLHPVNVVFGDPIRPEAFAAAPDPYAALTERLRTEVKRLSHDTD